MVPYTNEKQVVVESGVRTCVTLPAPARGTLTRLVVKQLDGALAGFDFDLYDRHDACSGVSPDSLNPEDGAELVDQDLHRLQARQTVAAAAAISGQYNLSIPYVNRDERDAAMQIPSGVLYLDIEAAGTGDKTFGIAWTVAYAFD